jgi:hypothetical protein
MKTYKRIVLIVGLIMVFSLSGIGSYLFAGEQEKDMIKSLEKVSSLSGTPDTPEFRQALSDCRSEIKMAKMIESDFPAFMKVAEETYLLFKSGLELYIKADDIYYDMEEYSVRAKINHVSKSEQLRKEGDFLQQRKAYLQQVLDKMEAGKYRLEGLYSVYKKEVLKK